MIDHVLGLADDISKHGNSAQKITGVSFKNSMTESTLAWTCLGNYLKEEGKSFHTPKDNFVQNLFHETVERG